MGDTVAKEQEFESEKSGEGGQLERHTASELPDRDLRSHEGPAMHAARKLVVRSHRIYQGTAYRGSGCASIGGTPNNKIYTFTLNGE